MLINKPLILSTGTGVAPAYTIDQSIRFNSADKAFITQDSGGSFVKETTSTISMWVKRAGYIGSGTANTVYGAFYGSGGRYDYINFNTSDQLVFGSMDTDATTSTGTNNPQRVTTQVFRDPSAWYHIVINLDTTHSVASERIRIYVNGTRITDFATETTIPQNRGFYTMSDGVENNVGAFQDYTTYNQNLYFDGYLAEVALIDGTALDPSSFGEYNSSNIWIPKDISGLTFGSNGIYYKGQDASALGDDSSGNTNDGTVRNLASHDQVFDTPVNNFCVMNAIENVPCTFSEGNLTIDSTANFTGNAIRGNIHIKGGSTGKWYYEVIGSLTGDYFSTGWQLSSIITPSGSVIGQSDSGAIGFYNTGSYQNASNVQGVITKPAAGDVIGVALDASTGEVFLRDDSGYFVGTLTSNVLSSGVVITGFSGEDLAIAARNSSSGTATYNFGQDGTFAGVKTAGGNTDANGIGNFFYTVPDGYLAICTKNLGS